MTRKLGKYLLREKLYESANSVIYRSVEETNHQPYILKVLKQDYPTDQELIRYKQEYAITHSLDLDGIIKAYGIESHGRTLAIILEDFGASSLQQLMQDSALFPEPKSERWLHFLDLAIAITEALEQLHTAQIIHKDINPSNIVFNPKTNQVKLIDFGISTALSQENPSLKHPTVLEGTLPYISPEQTGRMNRFVDYRTDFYSLGATFYELLTEHPPFVTTNAIELVHCHMAKSPLPPDQVLAKQGITALPSPITQIIMKLLAKTAEERYQSTWGLKADLEECYRKLEKTSRIDNFSLGIQDISDKFQIPQKLYGREQEVQRLLGTFEQISSNKEASTNVMMLVTGQPGIGKSALVREIHKPITAKNGYFITGKFEQFQRNIPYSALAKALQNLIRQLLTEGEKELEKWRQKLIDSLHPNAQIVIDVIPEIELIIGKQPACKTLGDAETQNRFNRVFRQFIQTFCQPEHPLVIFLDDLQWIDSATLNLIEVMMTDHELQHFFLIGAYRSNEVGVIHPLAKKLTELRQQNTTIDYIELMPLSLKWINQLLSETVKNPPESTLPLAQLVVQKTHGNPFFVNQLLKSLHREQLIAFNADKILWQWDIAQIESRNITENVVDLMIENINSLSTNTQAQLRLASCIGDNFDLKTLRIVSEKSDSEVFKRLLPAVKIGLILPLSVPDSELLIQQYKFSHDRIQQAAHTTIDPQILKATHLKIGQLLQANLSELEQAERIFEIVDHFNIAQELITTIEERSQLARLNLEAGQKAKESTAYAAALQYFSTGTQLLSDESWQQSYSLTFALHKGLAEACYLEGDLEQAQDLITLLLEKSQVVVDQATAYSLLILLHTLQAEYTEAIAVGRTALHLLGIEVPVDDLSEHLRHELLEAKNYWQARAISSLAHEPEMQSPEQVSAVQLLMQLIVPAYVTNQDLFAFLAAKSSNLSFHYGPTPESVLGYSCYGTVLSRAGDYQSGYEFALMALALTKRFGDLKNRAKACNLLADHAVHWVKPLDSIPALHDEGYEAALNSGDLQFAGYLLHAKVFHAFARGRNLEEILTECSNYLVFVQKTQNFLSINTLLAYRFAILNLLGQTDDTFTFHDGDHQESEFIEKISSHNDYFSSCFFHILRLQIAYLYGNFSMALECAKLAKTFLPAIRNFFQEAELTLYDSLSLAAAYSHANQQEQQQYRSQLEANLAQLKIWSEHCPENFLHKYLLVKAELARLDNNGMDAMALYDAAIAAAKESRFIQSEALGNELAAKFWFKHNKQEFAKFYFQRARYAYQLWGAKRKVIHIDETYAPWLDISPATANTTFTSMVVADSEQSLESLDLQSILRVHQALSEAIFIEELLAKLMKIAIENAGAQRGFLLLKKEGRWVIEASGHIEQPEVQILQSIPLEPTEPGQEPLLSSAIVYYVARSLENLVLDDAVRTEQYSQDPYIIQHQVRSVMCIPLILQGDLTGILYLENNLLESVFTTTQIEVTKLLSSQAAISLRNSQLYSALQESEQHLAQSNHKLAAQNLALEQARNNLANYNQTLEQRVNERTVELTEINEQLQEQIKERQVAEQKLQLANQELEKLATIDGLTQISNRRDFDQWFQQAWKQLKREQQPLSLILFDVDYFKDYNDHYSHQVGDDCLVAIAQVAKAIINRPGDHVSRYGGEEFAVILPNTDQVGAIAIAKRIQKAIRELAIPHATSQVSDWVSVSLGIATTVPAEESSLTELFGQADQALYAAKQQGRDRYTVHD